MCIRLREAGWKVWRLDGEMTLHDAAMLRFGQWWRRSVRAGHAFAEGAWLHGGSAERHWVVESLRSWFWSGLIPAALALGVIADARWSFILLAYPAQIARIATRMNPSDSRSWIVAYFLMLGKFPELTGQIRFLVHRLLLSKRQRTIEYK